MTMSISSSQADFLENAENITLMIHFAPSVDEQFKSVQQQKLAKAVYSSCVVLLSSYLERYVESIVVESVDLLNTESVPTGKVPQSLKIEQVNIQIDELNKMITQQERNTTNVQAILEKSRDVVNDCGWFLDSASVFGNFTPDSFINRDKFSNPWPDKIDQVFLCLGIPNIVNHVIRWEALPDSEGLRSKVKELVEKRNDIAHTGGTVPITSNDILEYIGFVRRLICGIDYRVGEKIEKIIGRHPWAITV